MERFATVKAFARAKYGLSARDEPTKAQVNTVTQMCRDKVLPARKAGRQWLIDMEAMPNG